MCRLGESNCRAVKMSMKLAAAAASATAVVLAAAGGACAASATPPDFGALHWRSIGPFRGGRVLAVAGASDDRSLAQRLAEKAVTAIARSIPLHDRLDAFEEVARYVAAQVA